jgi:hypothetical protein
MEELPAECRINRSKFAEIPIRTSCRSLPDLHNACACRTGPRRIRESSMRRIGAPSLSWNLGYTEAIPTHELSPRTLATLRVGSVPT